MFQWHGQKGPAQVPYEIVVEWFKNRDKVPLSEIKVVFLSDGEAGKSHTIARLMNDGTRLRFFIRHTDPMHRPNTYEWKKHLTKLVGNYNYFGAPFSYLLTYVDANDFGRIWEGFKAHIQGYAPEGFTCRKGSFAELNDTNSPLYLKTAKCQYSCGGEPITVYHIFARIPTQNE